MSNLHKCSRNSRDSIYTIAGLHLHYHEIRRTGYRKQYKSTFLAHCFTLGTQRFSNLALFFAFCSVGGGKKMCFVSSKAKPDVFVHFAILVSLPPRPWSISASHHTLIISNRKKSYAKFNMPGNFL